MPDPTDNPSKTTPSDKPEIPQEADNALLETVDASDLEAAIHQANQEAQQKNHKRRTHTSKTEYPDIVPEGAARKIKTSKKAAVTQKPLHAGTSLDVPSNSLLAGLRLQAAQQQRQKDDETQRQIQIETRLGETLYQVFVYLNDLTYQLNVIKPVIHHDYIVMDGHEIQKPAWWRGFVDYRTLAQSSGNTVGQVHLAYRLVSEQAPLIIEREGNAAESFRQCLFDFNLKTRIQEFRLDNHYLERARFTIAPEIKVNVRWEMDVSKARLIVETQNLNRLGFSRYVLAPEEITLQRLEEFSRLMLGIPNQFLRRQDTGKPAP